MKISTSPVTNGNLVLERAIGIARSNIPAEELIFVVVVVVVVVVDILGCGGKFY